jgi:hypothetical protein
VQRESGIPASALSLQNDGIPEATLSLRRGLRMPVPCVKNTSTPARLPQLHTRPASEGYLVSSGQDRKSYRRRNRPSNLAQKRRLRKLKANKAREGAASFPEGARCPVFAASSAESRALFAPHEPPPLLVACTSLHPFVIRNSFGLLVWLRLSPLRSGSDFVIPSLTFPRNPFDFPPHNPRACLNPQLSHLMTRNGKIARLPAPLRNELNRCMERGLPGRQLAEWLNSLPEVHEVLHAFFEGRAISEQNLSEWRQGGFVEWQTRNELLDRASNAADTSEDIDIRAGRMADHASRLLSTRYAIALAEWNGDPDDPAIANLKKLSPLVRDLATLRRGELRAASVRMQEYCFHSNWVNRRGNFGTLPSAGSYRGAARTTAPNLSSYGSPSKPDLQALAQSLIPPNDSNSKSGPLSGQIKPNQTKKEERPPVKAAPKTENPKPVPPPVPPPPLPPVAVPRPPAPPSSAAVPVSSGVPGSPGPDETPPVPAPGLQLPAIQRPQDWNTPQDPPPGPRRAIVGFRR